MPVAQQAKWCLLDGRREQRLGPLGGASGQVDGHGEPVDPGFVDHHVPAEVGTGPDSVKIWWGYLWDALDIRMRIDDLVVGADRIAGRYTAAGRMLVPCAGRPADGAAFTVPIMAIERFCDGRIVERWEIVDLADLVTG